MLAAIFAAACAINDDACPFDPAFYMCSISSEPDAAACQKCWQNYLIWLRSGMDLYSRNRCGKLPDVHSRLRIDYLQPRRVKKYIDLT